MSLIDQLNKTDDSGLCASEYVEVVQAVIDNQTAIASKPSTISVNGGAKVSPDSNGNVNLSITLTKGDKGDQGDQGEKGDNATIESQEYDEDGNTIIHWSDGTTSTIKKGDVGHDGSIVYPSMRVDASGYLVADIPDVSEGTSFSLDDGGYLCVGFPDIE